MGDEPGAPRPAAAGRARRAAALIAAALFAATAALFWPACDNGFVGNWDDDTHAYENPLVLGGLNFDAVVDAATSVQAELWLPTTWWSFQLDVELFGPGPRGFHRTNVLLHAANAALLFLALRALTGATWPPAAVAALFAAHPLRVESVAWVTERKDVLSGFFFFLGLLAYARYAAAPSTRRMVPVAVALALGLGAKAMLVTIPCVLLLLDYWPLGRVPWPGRTAGAGWWRAARPVVVEKWPLFALAAAAAWLTASAQSQKAVISLEIIPLPHRLANAALSYAAYLSQTIWPADLAAFYPHLERDVPMGRAAAAAALLAAVTGLAVWQARRRPYLVVGWLWYLGTLVPVIGLVQVGPQARADRFTYLPHVGLFVAVVWGVADVVGVRRGRRVVAACAAVAAVVACAALTRVQIAVWKDSRTLWEHALAVTGSTDAELHLVDLDLAAGDRAAAAARLERVLQLRPDFEVIERRLGELLAALGRSDEAIAHYRELVRRVPDSPTLRGRLGDLLLDAGRWDEAEEQYAELVRLKGGAAPGGIGLGRVQVWRGRTREAVVLFARALGGDPGDPAVVAGIGRALLEAGLPDDAAAAFNRALELRPGDTAALFGRGTARAVRGRWIDAAADFAAAAERSPADPQFAFARAHALGRVPGRAAESAAGYAAALRLAPDWPERSARSAWQMATRPSPESRAGPLVVLLAEQASEARGGTSAEALDALAAAYAEAGRWDDAVAAADKAATAAQAGGRAKLAAEVRARGELYRSRKPYRQTGGK
jgi:tetratricopeptide (TPR) repeat protein